MAELGMASPELGYQKAAPDLGYKKTPSMRSGPFRRSQISGPLRKSQGHNHPYFSVWLVKQFMDRWELKETLVKEKKDMEKLLVKAEDGNVFAMEKAGNQFNHGTKGFPKDEKMAFEYYDRARVAGSILGMTKVGDKLVRGRGIEKDVAKGMMYLGMAAGQGSNFAAYLLGMYMAEGKHGVSVDKEEAHQMLEKCLSESCAYNNMTTQNREKASEKLEELTNELTLLYAATMEEEEKAAAAPKILYPDSDNEER